MDRPALSAQLRAVVISGITVRLARRLKRPLRVKLIIDGTYSCSIRIKQQEEPEREYLLKDPLNLRDGSTISITVQENYWFRRDKTIAQLNLPLANMWPVEEIHALEVHTRNYQIHISSSGKQMWLNLVVLPSPSQIISTTAEQILLVSEEGLEDSGVVEDILQRLQEFKATLDRLGGAELEKAVNIAMAASELHPGAEAAANGIRRLICNRFGTGARFRDGALLLAESMAQTLNHILSVDEITISPELRHIIRTFPDLMNETVHLIEWWLASGTPESVDDAGHIAKLTNLKRHFDEFIGEFDRHLVLESAVKERNSKKSRELDNLRKHLDKIVDVPPRAAECLDGTRVNVLSDIEDQIADAENKNVIWIRGFPGSGKSSVSVTIKKQLHRQGQLLTYFRFDRNDPTVTTPHALWSRVAYDLAERYPSVLEKNLSLLKGNRVILESAVELFTSLVEEPLSQLVEPPPNHPLVIVVDALDECGDVGRRSFSNRGALLQTLRRWPKLPKHFKLLVTSREELDIVRALSHISAIIDIPSGHSIIENPQEPTSIEASRDIQMFLGKRLREIRESIPLLPLDWPGVVMIAEMTLRAAGNFMWATAATDFIDSDSPQERLASIMSQTSESLRPLYSLYSTILDASFGNLVPNSSGVQVLRAVLGTIIFARRPLGVDEYTKLPTDRPLEKARVEFIRDRLRSVIDQGPTLRFVHKTFDDFLLSEECPPKYAIDENETQGLLIKLCLTTIKAELHFNLCNLETSYLKNEDVPDIDVKVKNGVSKLLSYSCTFWTDHLMCIPFKNNSMVQVKAMLQDKLLYWFEAMSLLKEMNRVSHALFSVLDWLTSSSDEDFKAFIRDACQFINAFIYPITQSAPHIYISALPLAPARSLIAQHFLPRFSKVLSLSTGKQINWPSYMFTSEYHKRSITAIAFSPDEKSFISGSNDHNVCICDSETGNLISGPLKGDHYVYSVFFSPDCRHVWASHRNGQVICWDIESGDKHFTLSLADTWDIYRCCYFDGGPNIVSISHRAGTVTLWDTTTGEQLQELLKIQDNDGVGELEGSSMASFSPDGRYLAWAKYGAMALKIWNLVDGSEFKCQVEVQGRALSIFVLSFAVDGPYAVTGSEHGTLTVWDARTAEPIANPLTPGFGGVTAVAYLHAKGLIVLGFATGMLMVKNSSTNEIILEAFEGHPCAINVIALSQDGQRALSTSDDNTVRMWDLVGEGTSRAQDCITNSSESSMTVTFSFTPCGKKLVSVGADKILRVWDATTCKEIHLPYPIDTHNNGKSMKIIVSPQGNQVVIYVGYILQLWNVDTGELGFSQSFSDGWDRDRNDPHLAFRSTDRRLITCSRLGVVRAWCLEHGSMTEDTSISSPIPVDAGSPVYLRGISPDGLTILVDDIKRTPRFYLWSTTRCQPLPITFTNDQIVGDVTFSPNGFLAISFHTMVAIWNIHTGKIITTHAVAQTQYLAFSPDNRHIAFFRHHSVLILNVTTGHLVTLWDAHVPEVRMLSFSPDGKKLGSISLDGQLRVWDIIDLIDSEGSEPSVGFLGVGEHMQDGWVMDKDNGLLFWVPQDHRGGLKWARNTGIIGGTGIPTEFDFTDFRYGQKWAECCDAGSDKRSAGDDIFAA